jgi:hypothetical protein
MTRYEYLGGLPAGETGDGVAVRVMGGVLHFSHERDLLRQRRGQPRPWTYDLPLADIDDVAVTDCAELADPEAARGTRGSCLVLDARLASGAMAVVVQGKPGDLDRLRRDLLRARTIATVEREW